MRRFCFIFLLFLLIFGGFNMKSNLAYADMKRSDMVIVIENASALTNEQIESFYGLNCPITFVDSSFSYFKKHDKLFVNSIDYSDNKKVLANENTFLNFLNAINYAKENEICFVVFDASVCDYETIFFTLSDNVGFVVSMNVVLKLYSDFI